MNKISKGQGGSFKCKTCRKDNVPVLQICGEYGFYLCLCQKCITKTFQEYEIKKGVNYE